MVEWRKALEAIDIKVLFSSIRHPESNPTERVMREIGRMCRTFCSANHTAWANHIGKIQDLLNITTHHSTLCTPQELHFGKPIENEISKFVNFPEKPKVDQKYLITFARENMLKNFKRRQKMQKPSTVKLDVGDLVLLRTRHLSNALDKTTRKFFHLYEGPYNIAKALGKNAYLLKDENDEVGIYNRKNLRKYKK